MTNQILNNLKSYITERQKQTESRYESTESEYSLGKSDALEEIINYIIGEEMHIMID